MSEKTDERLDEALSNNQAEFMEHGPGLRWTTQIENGARCPTGNHVLRCGLGGCGVGQMWGAANDERRADPLWDELPTEPCGNAECGCAGEVFLHGRRMRLVNAL